MPIDGILIESEILDFDLFKSYMNVELKSIIGMDSSELIPYYKDTNIHKYKYTAKKDSLYYEVIEIYSKISKETKYKLFISGSLHSNQFEGANFNDFYYSMLVSQIDKIMAIKGIDSNKIYLRNLEVGINVKVAFNVLDHLERNLLVYKGNSFNQYKYDRTGKYIGFYCELPSRFEVKIYDKSILYDLPYNLLRYEIKFKRMQTLNKLGIYQLSDLKNKRNLELLFNEILTKFDYILLNEMPLKKLSKAKNNYYQKVSNPIYWKCLSNEKNNTIYQNKRRKFEAFKGKYCTNIKNTLKSSMEAKFEELIQK